MAPTTRSKRLKTPSPSPSGPRDYTTTKKMRFFDAWDDRDPGASLRAIARRDQLYEAQIEYHKLPVKRRDAPAMPGPYKIR
jgi:hypothetical protein